MYGIRKIVSNRSSNSFKQMFLFKRGKEPLKFIWSTPSANKHPTVWETMTNSWTSFSMESLLSESLLSWKETISEGWTLLQRSYLTCSASVFWTLLFLFWLCGSSHIHKSREVNRPSLILNNYGHFSNLISAPPFPPLPPLHTTFLSSCPRMC